eukprot:gene21839-26283_t
MTSVGRIPEAAEATTVSFTFEGSDVDFFQCQLDGGTLELCESPYEAAWLSAGNHTFMVTATLKGSGELVKEVAWEVAPRLHFAQEVTPAELSMPNVRTEFLELLPVKADQVAFSILSLEVRLASEWPAGSSPPPPEADGAVALMARAEKEDKLVVLDLDASAVNASTVGNYTVWVAVQDVKAECTSVISAWVAVTVHYQSTLLLMPSTGDVVVRSGSRADVVVAGQMPQASAAYIINIGTGGAAGADQSEPGDQTTCTTPTMFNVTAMTNQTWARVEPTSGTLHGVGDQASLTVVISELLNQTTTSLEASFSIFNSADGSDQRLRVLMTIVPSVISNITVAVAKVEELRTGGAAEWTVAPLDEFGNAIVEGSDGFLVDAFLLRSSAGGLEEVDREVDWLADTTFDDDSGLYISRVNDVTPYGEYRIYLRYVDRGQTQEALTVKDAALGGNWSDPQGCQLHGSPLSFYFEPVQCDAERHQRADADGKLDQILFALAKSVMVATAVVPDAERFKPERVLGESVEGYGNYGTQGAGAAEACSKCHYEDSTDRLTTLREDATSLEECVCRAGYSHSAGNFRNCTACPPGHFQDRPNATDCKPCAIGTLSRMEARDTPCTEHCSDARTVAHVEGLSECVTCASNAHAEYLCQYNGTWHIHEDADVCNSVAPNTTRAACVCNPDYYQTLADDLDLFINQTCSACSEGALCLGSIMRGLPGYWRRSTAHDRFYACASEDVCLGELHEQLPAEHEAYVTDLTADRTADLTVYFTTGRADFLYGMQLAGCAAGHEAVLCGSCQDDWVLSGQGTCQQCGDTAAEQTSGHILTAVCLALALSALVVWLQRPFYSEEEAHYREMAVQGLKRAVSRLKEAGRELKERAAAVISDGQGRGFSLTIRSAAVDASSGAVGLAAPEAQGDRATHVEIVCLAKSGVDSCGAEEEDGKGEHGSTGTSEQRRTREHLLQDGTNRSSDPQKRPSDAISEGGHSLPGKTDTVKKGVKGLNNIDPGKTGQSADRAGAAGAGEQKGNLQFLPEARQMCAVLLSFSQISSSYNSSFGIDWPAGFSGLLTRISVLNFALPGLPGVPSTSCTIHPLGWLLMHRLIIVLPVLAVLFISGLATASYQLQSQRRHLVEEKQYRFFLVRTVLFILYLSYISLSIRMLAFFKCTQVYDDWYLDDDLHVQCWVGAHARNLPIALVGVCLYPLGLPAVFLYFLWRYHVPSLAKVKVRACLLHAALERLAPETYGTSRRGLEDPLVDLEAVSLTELQTLSARAVLADSNQPQAAAGLESALGKGLGVSNPEPRLHRLVRRASTVDSIPEEAEEDEEEELLLEDQLMLHGKVDLTLVAAEREALIDYLGRWVQTARRGKQFATAVFWDTTDRNNTVQRLQSRWAVLEAYAVIRVGFIFKAYHVQLALTGGIVFLDKGSITQIATAIMICFVAICVHLSLRPDVNPVAHVFTMMTLVLLFYNLLLGLVLKCLEDSSKVDDMLMNHLLMWPTIL